MKIHSCYKLTSKIAHPPLLVTACKFREQSPILYVPWTILYPYINYLQWYHIQASSDAALKNFTERNAASA